MFKNIDNFSGPNLVDKVDLALDFLSNHYTNVKRVYASFFSGKMTSIIGEMMVERPDLFITNAKGQLVDYNPEKLANIWLDSLLSKHKDDLDTKELNQSTVEG